MRYRFVLWLVPFFLRTGPASLLIEGNQGGPTEGWSPRSSTLSVASHRPFVDVASAPGQVGHTSRALRPRWLRVRLARHTNMRRLRPSGLLVAPVDKDKQVSASDKEDANRPFRVVAQSSDNTEALQDFDRHRQRGTWERAFKALEKAKTREPERSGARATTTFYIPSRVYLRQALATMPQAGKEAYRLFQDPEARKILERGSRRHRICRAGEDRRGLFPLVSGRRSRRPAWRSGIRTG